MRNKDFDTTNLRRFTKEEVKPLEEAWLKFKRATAKAIAAQDLAAANYAKREYEKVLDKFTLMKLQRTEK